MNSVPLCQQSDALTTWPHHPAYFTLPYCNMLIFSYIVTLLSTNKHDTDSGLERKCMKQFAFINARLLTVSALYCLRGQIEEILKKKSVRMISGQILFTIRVCHWLSDCLFRGKTNSMELGWERQLHARL